MPFSKVRRDYFDLGSRALERVAPGRASGLYACPVCARTYPPECLAMNPWVLCLGYAPSRKLDPDRMPAALVCAECFGSSATNDPLVRPFLTEARLLPDLDVFASKASNSAIASASLFVRRFGSSAPGEFVTAEPCPDPIPGVLLWSAFMAAFAVFGYRYVFSDGGTYLRRQLSSPGTGTGRMGYFRTRSLLPNRWTIGASTFEDCWFPVVILETDVVLLPPMRLNAASFCSNTCESIGRLGGFELRRLGWPLRPNHYLDTEHA